MQKGKNFNIWFVLLVYLVIISLFVFIFSKNKNDINDNFDEYYYVYFNTNGGNDDISPQQVLSGTAALEPIEMPTREGYNFIGWYMDLESDKPYDFNTLIYSDVILYAKWIDKELASNIQIGFETNSDDFINTIIIKQGENVELPTPVKSGYSFSGWYNSDDKIEKTNIISSDITVTAHWEKIDDEKTVMYTIVFDSKGGSNVLSQSIEEGKTAKNPGTPTRSGYTFVGWYNGSEKFDFNTQISGNMTIEAKWQENKKDNVIDTIKTFLVTFDSNGGSIVSSQTVESGKTVTKPSNPTKTGYDFLAWYNGSTAFDFNTKITSNITLTAMWKKKASNEIITTTYIVTFDSNGGSAVSSQVVESGNTAIRPTSPTRSGYTFAGWYNGNAAFDFNTKITSNITLTAKWNATNTISMYTVTFNSDGGSTVASQIVESGKMVTKPSDPTKFGYDFVGWYNGNTAFNFNTKITSNITLTAKWKVSKNLYLEKNIDLIPNSTNISDMQKNTESLQNAINIVSENGGGNVIIPSGTYYFSQGGSSSRGSRYVIRCRNNVHLKGAGTNENDTNNLTVLKPYYEAASGSRGSLDMFYFNNYADTGYNTIGNVTTSTKRDIEYKDINGQTKELTDQTVYLINADFSDFIIDGELVHGGTYTTNGKGFMINLFMNCDWYNIVVKNTDGTGFGMDCPINSTITNSKAISCGKLAKSSTNEGASGFGIGVGYSNQESITISNSVAINNKKFGFFFEHQSRFNNYYPATSSNNYVVKNSVAGGNMYDFGGLKAFNVKYINVESLSGSDTYNDNHIKSSITLNSNTFPIYFSMYSKNILIDNSNFSNYINDINSTSVNKFSTEIKWAINNGILPLDMATSFSPKSTVNRFDAIRSLYKYKKMPGTITTLTTITESSNAQNEINSIGFNDLGGSEYKYELDSIIWAYNNGIITKSSSFNPSSDCTRAQFMTMLYRMVGSPNVSGTVPFSDVSEASWYYKAVLWGYNKGIVKGSTSSSFKPNDSLTNMQLAIFLYRYDNM